ncbi:MAG: hypothetical protein KUL88_07025 [Rhizobium sp.]|nr:hypothetical protein [Rhizobium sp.]
MNTKKNILVVPLVKPVEALRMATGLTLLDDRVTVHCLAGLPAGPETDEQLEALEFSEVPVRRQPSGMEDLARAIVSSDVVYLV